MFGAAGGPILGRMDEVERGREIERLYRQAFAEYGAVALWSSRAAPHPNAADALAIARSLRFEGDLGARRLAEQIESVCGLATH